MAHVLKAHSVCDNYGIVWLTYGALTSLGMGTSATLISVGVGGLVYVGLAVFLRMFDKNDMEFIPGLAKIQNMLVRKKNK